MLADMLRQDQSGLGKAQLYGPGSTSDRHGSKGAFVHVFMLAVPGCMGQRLPQRTTA